MVESNRDNNWTSKGLENKSILLDADSIADLDFSMIYSFELFYFLKRGRNNFGC
jgi:hypothetical protein